MTVPIACPKCFSNWGFRQVVASHADLPDAACPQCSNFGPLIASESLADAVRVFFVEGSYVAETFAPVYHVNSSNPHPAKFDATLDDDAKLACSLTAEVIFDYGPPLWRVGEVDLKHAFDQGGEKREDAARAFVANAPRIQLQTGTQLFRIRKNPDVDETITTPTAFDPPSHLIERSPGRWDDGHTAVLYASDDIELCLHECRVLTADEIVVASLLAARPLTLLDLTAEFPLSGTTAFEDPNIFARFLSLSRLDQWLEHARAVARAAESAGLDGIRYTSYYAQAKHHSNALNVALFGRVLEAGDLAIDSVNRLRLTDARYQFSFGPVLYHDSAMKAELARVLEEINASGAKPV